ncbi:MAG: TolC family protein, partial [Planctomycetota bacterium]
MHRRNQKRCAWLLILSALLTGCQPIQPYYLNKDGDADLSHYLDVATEIEYTDVCQDPIDEVTQAYSPRTISNPQFDEFWDLSLEDAMSHAMHNSKVIRTFGQVRQFGQILGGAPERLTAAPDSVATVYDTAIQETGQSGVEQALAAFDAVFSSNATWDSTDRAQNFNGAQNVNATAFQQDQVTINNEISKLSAGGTQWFFRNVSIYTGANNANTANTRSPGIPSDWTTAMEAEIRHPLMRNRGAQLNRAPVVLARIRTDLSLIDFQGAVRDLLSSVEQSYWELYFFYHNLRAAKIGRDSALAAHQKVRALYDEGAPGGEAEKEAQAREQYFFFRDRVEQAQRDLFRSETRLRYLMGLSPTDHRLIRPSDKPTAARVEFDWNLITEEAQLRSGELRRLGFRIRQRELELIAARNQMLPQLDVIGLWRQFGIGDRFATGSNQPFPAIGSSAWDRLWSGHFQEFRLGFDMQMPLGLRREMAQ